MPPTDRPDILWIVTTQWRGQACGFAGDPNARTPNLDDFAGRAIVFEQAFSNHPFGPFARAVLLTGQLSPENGVADYWDPLPRDADTIARRLAAAGYATAFFGKWHLATRDRTAPVVGEAHARQIVEPEDRGGFEFWEGFESGFQLNDPWLHGTRLPAPVHFHGYQADVLCARAAEWLQTEAPCPSAVDRHPASRNRHSRRPRFVVVSLESPHPPYAAATPPEIPPPDPAALELAPSVPRGGEIETTARRELCGYYRHITATDRAIGRLLAHVDLASTAVFITSAHGDMHGAHGLFRKGWPYEEAVRVPFLARWPGVDAQRVRTPVSLADLPATAVALAGAELPPNWPGADVRQLLRETDRCVPLSMPSTPPFEKQCPHPWSGWRSRDELHVFTPDGQPWLAFDLRTDPGQEHNLAERET
ncbi:MAG TPA: sulfatase-like hydrolase/transferase [Opitutaceae bacterium]|nr:sulfatase-like hydrolase/transferase [Opitutaceae bacterium]